MAKLIMYLPFNDKGMFEPACMFTDRIDYLELFDEESVIVVGEKNIDSEDADIKNGDALYIAGHCGKGINYIADTKGNTLQGKELAQQFKGRLDKGHLEIRVWACYSGEGLHKKEGLAYNFWKEMQVQGYKKLTVYGYRMGVLDPFNRGQENLIAAEELPGFKSLMDTPDLIEFKPGTAENWMTGIRPDGKIIPPAPLPRPIKLPDVIKKKK